MASRTIRILGDPVLRTKARHVIDFDRSLRTLVADLTETMHDADGSGLAANQIGVQLRVFTYVVIDRDSPDYRSDGHLVNPVITEQSEDEVETEEGCLSIPGMYYPLARAQRVVARGFDMHGDPVEIAGSDMLARALMHETDHLDGVLFLDRLDPDTRKRAMREIREASVDGTLPRVKASPHSPLG